MIPIRYWQSIMVFPDFFMTEAAYCNGYALGELPALKASKTLNSIDDRVNQIMHERARNRRAHRKLLKKHNNTKKNNYGNLFIDEYH